LNVKQIKLYEVIHVFFKKHSFKKHEAQMPKS